ncbi:TPA: transposase, partial [Citrobacter braakii]|nr:transposase [Citrobacter braakii]
MNTLVSNTSLSGTLIALDIAKKHHDAKIRHPDGRTSYLRIENTLEGFNRLLALTASPHDDIIAAFEPTADYHRNIAWWLHKQGVKCHLVSSVRCARAREMLFKTWDKNDRKD